MSGLKYALILCLLPALSLAQSLRPSDAVLDAMHLGELMQILEDEAVSGAEELSQTLLDGQGGASWQQTIADINASETLLPELREDFARALPEADAPGILKFLKTERGMRIIGLEITARAALADPAVEAFSQDTLAEAVARDDPRLELLAHFIEVNDLVDTNVASALNANYAFLDGMRAGGAAGNAPASDAVILEQVMLQEPKIRADTHQWLYSYLLLAYQPLSDADLEAYIAFSESDAGQSLNTALAVAFDAMFQKTSRLTGEAAGRILASQDI